MDDYKVFAKRIGLIGFLNFVVGLSGIILLPILTKKISIEEYGMWSQAMVTITIVPAVVTLGLPYTMVRYLPSAKMKSEIQEIFYSILILILFASLTSAFFIYLFSENISVLLFGNNTFLVKIVSIIIFVECLNSLFLNYYRATQQIKKYSLFMFIQTLFQVIFVTFFVLNGNGLIGAIIGYLIKDLIVSIMTIYDIIREIGITFPKFTHLYTFLHFGIPTVPGNVASWVTNSSDRYLIGFFLGVSAVGYYSPAYSLGSLISILIAPLSFLLPPVLSKYYDQNNISEVKYILDYSLKYFLLLAIPAFFGVSLLSKSLLEILSTTEIANSSFIITPFIALSTLLFGLFTVVMQVIILEKKTIITGKIFILAALLNLGLNIIFIPKMGIIAAGITTLLGFLVMFILTLYESNKYIKTTVDLIILSKSIFASIVMCLIIVKMNPIGLVSIVITAGICMVVYLLTLVFLRCFERKEYMFILNLFKQ